MPFNLIGIHLLNTFKRKQLKRHGFDIQNFVLII